MSEADPALVHLVEQLEAMQQADRDLILADLSEEECGKLLPLLSPSGDSALSPALSALLRRCQVEPPSSVTPRIAGKLIETAQWLGADREPPRPGRPGRARPFLDRLAGRWGSGS